MIVSLYSRADIFDSQATFLPYFTSMEEKVFKIHVHIFLIFILYWNNVDE